jgi:hypothetical protein
VRLKWKLQDLEKVYEMKSQNNRPCVRSCVIMPRRSCGFQDPGHKIPSQGFKILIRIQGCIQEYDVA